MRRTTRDDARERGAILPMAAAGIVVAILAAALSIDLGAIAHKRRDLQKIADLASIDAVYELDAMEASGTWPLDVTDLPMLLAGTDPATIAAHDSARRNGLEPTDAMDFVVELGVYERDASTEFTSCLQILDVLALPDCAANAVRVGITDETPKYFALGPGGSGDTTVDAIATMGTHSGLVTLQVGSFAGRVSADTSGLTTLIMSRGLEEIVDAPTGSLSADVVSYQGIASTTVTLGELAAVLTGGDVDALLASELSYADVLNATATVLQNQGDAAAADSVLVIAENVSTAGTYGVVEGTVLDEGGAAIAGASVTVPASAEPAITDAGGAYRIENVTAGPRTVTAEAPGYESNSTIVDVPADGTVTAPPVTLAGGPYDGTPPDAQTGDGGGSLSGSLTFSWVNHLSAGDSSELNTLDLIVGAAYIANGDNAIAIELTSADLPPELAAIASIDATVQVIEPPTIDTVPVGVPVTSSQVRIEAVVTLASAYALQTGSTLVGAIAGTVTDAATGQPIPGATATLDLIGLTPATTDADGTYSIVNVAAGAHTVTFDAPGYAARTETVTVTGGQTAQLSVTLTSNLPAPGQQGNGGTALLLAPGTITGTIVDSATGLPIPSVTVNMDALVNATTDAAGVYRIVRVTNTLPHTLTVTREGYGTKLATVIVPPNGTVTKNFQLDPDPVVLGQIGDGGAAILDTTIETSQVQIPFLIELARASAEATDIDCVTAADLLIDAGAASWGVGTPDGDFITSPAASQLPSELSPVDVLLSDLLTGLAEIDPFAALPDPAPETVTLQKGEQYTSEIVPPGVIPAEVDDAVGQPLADELELLLELSDLLGTLTPEELAANLAVLRSTIEETMEAGSDGQAELLTLIDAIGSSFGVGLLGADVTLLDVLCPAGVTGSGVRAPMLVE